MNEFTKRLSTAVSATRDQLVKAGARARAADGKFVAGEEVETPTPISTDEASRDGSKVQTHDGLASEPGINGIGRHGAYQPI